MRGLVCAHVHACMCACTCACMHVCEACVHIPASHWQAPELEAQTVDVACVEPHLVHVEGAGLQLVVQGSWAIRQ